MDHENVFRQILNQHHLDLPDVDHRTRLPIASVRSQTVKKTQPTSYPLTRKLQPPIIRDGSLSVESLRQIPVSRRLSETGGLALIAIQGGAHARAVVSVALCGCFAFLHSALLLVSVGAGSTSSGPIGALTCRWDLSASGHGSAVFPVGHSR